MEGHVPLRRTMGFLTHLGGIGWKRSHQIGYLRRITIAFYGREDLPQMGFGHEPAHGGKVVAGAVSRELGDIPAMTAAEAACAL